MRERLLLKRIQHIRSPLGDIVGNQSAKCKEKERGSERERVKRRIATINVNKKPSNGLASLH